MNQVNPAQIASLQISHPDYLWPQPWVEVFGNECPVHLDVGAGDGGFLLQAAKVFPTINFMGIERLLGRVRKIDKKARRECLSNIRVLRLESSYAVKCLIAPASVQAIHLYHPDPFPKKKQHKRRLVNDEFIASVAKALRPGGIFYVRTDHHEYYEIIVDVVGRSGKFSLCGDENPFALIPTDFEKEYRDKGVEINFAQYRLLNA